MLSTKTSNALSGAGWIPERRVETGAFRRDLERNGYDVFPCVLEFLARFGGLEFSVGRVRHVHFVPGEAALSISPFKVEGYAARVGRPLSVIGAEHAGLYILMMDDQGAVYSAHDDALHRVAATGEAAIEAIFDEGRDGTDIPERPLSPQVMDDDGLESSEQDCHQAQPGRGATGGSGRER